MLTPATHRSIYQTGLCLLALGMMVGTVPTSVPQMIIAGNWLLEGDFAAKWRRLSRNRIFWILSSVYFLHLAGLTWTQDMDAGWQDLRTKIPMLFLPVLLFSSSAINLQVLLLALRFFILGCVVNITWCLVYAYVLHPGEVLRSVSRFMSHIRLGLYLDLAIAACIYFTYHSKTAAHRIGYPAIAAFLISGMVIMGLATGIAFAVLLGILAVAIFILRTRGRTRVTLALALIFVLAFAVHSLRSFARTQLVPAETNANIPAEKNAAGNLYIHFDEDGQKENGHYVLINIQPDELQRAWKRDFPGDSFSYPTNHNLQRYEVLVRYMASKGLMKDSAGFNLLTPEDKRNIRRGVTNYLVPSWGRWQQRLYELVNEYDEFRNNRHVSGHSLSMRLYYWQGALLNIRQRPLTGCGTGDVQQVQTETYIKEKMPLKPKWFLRPHNQYLTIAVALGIPVGAWFVFTLIYPAVTQRKKVHVLYWPFLILAAGSFIFEDTLETQAGLTFYVFFNTLFLAHAGDGDNDVLRQ